MLSSLFDQSMEERKAKYNETIEKLRDAIALLLKQGENSTQAKRIVEHAAKRARVKATMLPHLDSSLLACAIDESRGQLEEMQVSTDINACIMSQMQEEGGKPFPEKSTSNRSNQEETEASVTNSISNISDKLNEAEEVSADEIVAPLRDFAYDLATHEELVRDEPKYPPRLSIRRISLEEERLAMDFDFDMASSPRSLPSPHHDKLASHRLSMNHLPSRRFSKVKGIRSEKGVGEPFHCETCEHQPDINLLAHQTPEGSIEGAELEECEELKVCEQ